MRILINDTTKLQHPLEQCIAHQSYFTSKEPKGSQSQVPEDSSDESHMKEKFTTQKVIKIIGELQKCIKPECLSRLTDPDSQKYSSGIQSLE